MIIRWTDAAKVDLFHLHSFLAQHDGDAADKLLDLLIEAPEKLLTFPRRGSRLVGFGPRQLYEFHVGNYRLRYELSDDELLVIRIFHEREDRL